jgi:hypothetical protein
MINFMHDEDYPDHIDNSGPFNACSDSFSSPLCLSFIHYSKMTYRKPKNKSRSRQKLNDSFAGNNLSDQNGDIMLANVYSNPSYHHVPLASVHQTSKVKETVSIAGSKSKTGGNWPILGWLMILEWQVATPSLQMTVFLLAP